MANDVQHAQSSQARDIMVLVYPTTKGDIPMLPACNIGAGPPPKTAISTPTTQQTSNRGVFCQALFATGGHASWVQLYPRFGF